ncbi:hypothetical protein BJX66DRAFT_336289 [Aspergillus keveii]|uniref:Uncharacterized protein n=1 Tax=Aspergillus keveii TaxID=714993 RepID=A0ABR4GAG4_9EURO
MPHPLNTVPQPPNTVLDFYERYPDASFSDYLAKVMAQPTSAIFFTKSLHGKDRPIVRIAQIKSAI